MKSIFSFSFWGCSKSWDITAYIFTIDCKEMYTRFKVTKWWIHCIEKIVEYNNKLCTYPATAVSGATLHITPRSSEHRPVTGSGGARFMYGGSSRNVILMWNFSGTPWGGVCWPPGHTMSFISKRSWGKEFHVPISSHTSCKRKIIVVDIILL